MNLSSNSWTYTVPAGEDAVSAMCRVLQVNRSTYYYEEKPGPDEAGLSSETAFAAINAWRDRSRRRQKEISLEYLTEEKFYPLGTTDEYFEAPYEEYPITICGQTVILTNGELAAALLSLPEYDRVSNPQDFTASAQRNGGAFTWGIRTFYPMKRLSGRPVESRKP